MGAIAPFAQRYWRAVRDPQLRRNLLAFQRGWRQSRQERFAEYVAPDGRSGEEEFDLLRHRLATAKDATLRDSALHFARFKSAAEANGAVVYEAATPEQARQYVLDLCRRVGADLVVKTKTMVSEEIYLNHYLEEHGIRAVETDLGEWIIQLRRETPSHMVIPAIHLNRYQVSQTFAETTGREVSPDNVTEMVRLARSEMRRDFLAAKVGLTGANALIAESGTTMLVTNEGNEPLVATLPPIQVVLAGYEKLIPSFKDAVTQLRLLARSATGQHITTYTTFISGPEPDHELHYVFLDNGRSTMASDPDYVDALRCIRCAACANVCPPYQVVGGHVFGYIYSGAIGLVNTPFHHGLAEVSGPQSLCVSCNACQTVCPVDIPLPRQILDVRRTVVQRRGLPRFKRIVLGVWARPALFRLFGTVAAVLSRPLVRDGLIRMPLPRRHAWRVPPAPAIRLARDRLASIVPPATSGPLADSAAKGMTVAYLIQCLTDRLAPGQAEASVNLLTACGVRVIVPKAQHCCGLPMIDSGDTRGAKALARQTIAMFEQTGADYIVSPANSCVVAMAHDYPHLFQDEPAWKARAERLAARVLDLATFLDRIAQLPAGALADGASADSFTYHPFCQTLNVLHADGSARRLLTEVCGLALKELPESYVCCGFGGSTSFDAPEVAHGIVERKLENVDGTGASVLISDNPGCLMHLRGAAAASGQQYLRVRHLSEVLADHLDRHTKPSAESAT